MSIIQVLDSETVDKIAAGEVVQRPLNVVKELVENAIDAGALAVTVEIKEGGIEFIRVTDNGGGIDSGQVKTAFLRHATSKIRRAQDLTELVTLGFRGEALSSIAAVSKVELITKTREALTGIRYAIEGGKDAGTEEIGAPEGTTVIVRNLFYNTPVRRKFLKHAITEAGYITDLMEHLALCRPDISFQYLVNGQMKFHTSGNGELKEVIYRIYGKETAANLVELKSEINGMKVQGYLGKPVLNRSNRNFETYFVNGRYVKSQVISKAIEEGYKEYIMQHKYPFTVLHMTFDTQAVDVNVHPSKMDVRFSDAMGVADFISSSVTAALKVREMIPEVMLKGQSEERAKTEKVQKAPEPFEAERSKAYRVAEEMKYETDEPKMKDNLQNPVWNRVFGENTTGNGTNYEKKPANIIKAKETVIVEKLVQMDLFEEKILSREARGEYRILGQIFDTYWLVAFKDKLFIVDQHAAHEKVKYERLIAQYEKKQMVSQLLNPPVVVTLTGKEEAVLKEFLDFFQELGFDVEEFGGSEYALRSVPADLYGCGEKEMFEAVLDELSDGAGRGTQPQVVAHKIASMSCKAAVKGNTPMSLPEIEALIEELLTLENPYNCPHGRPTIISMSKYEIEKKFKRIV